MFLRLELPVADLPEKEKFLPLQMMPTLAPVTAFLESAEANDDMEVGFSLAQYVAPLRNVAVTRMLMQLSEVYKVMQIDALAKLASPLAWPDVEMIIVEGMRNGLLSIRVDHQHKCINFEPQALASGELYPRNDVWEELLGAGFTTLGLYPAGNGIPGQAVAVQPLGSTVEDMIVRDPAYLRIQLFANPGSKKMLRDGFESVDKFEEKEAERREKWEEKQEKAKKRKKKKKDDDEEEDDEEEEVEEWVPETPDPDVQVFQKVRAGELAALVEIRRAADWLHLLDAIGDEEFTWAVRLALRNDTDFGEVLDEIGEAEKVAVVDPMLTLVAGTREVRNLPAELAAAGAEVAFVPARENTVSGHESLRTDVGLLLADGLERDVALRALTLAPARVLGLDDRIGSLEVGKDANLVFFDGDPLSPTSRVQAVMIGGRFVVGEVN